MELAPIVLFVYNRPWHTRQTLEALAKNELADQSELYIYADGAKPNATNEDKQKINEVRALIREKTWCQKVTIIEQTQNKGLANSIIEGVTEIVNKHGKIIVLEDDLVTGNGFLKFINQGLFTYRNSNLAGVTGWSYGFKWKHPVYFSFVGSCWGWGTWQSVWKEINFDANFLIQQISLQQRANEFNVEGTYNYFDMLEGFRDGKNNSWAIRFYANYFLKKQLFLFPTNSMVANIGKDGSGTHYNQKAGITAKFILAENNDLPKETLSLNELPAIRELIKKSFQPDKSIRQELLKVGVNIIANFKRVMAHI